MCFSWFRCSTWPQVSAVTYGNLVGSTAVHMGLAFAAACMLFIVREAQGRVPPAGKHPLFFRAMRCVVRSLSLENAITKISAFKPKGKESRVRIQLEVSWYQNWLSHPPSIRPSSLGCTEGVGTRAHAELRVRRAGARVRGRVRAPGPATRMH